MRSIMPKDSASSDRLAIVAALEQLECGDTWGACETLLAALEAGPADRPYRCECGLRFEWPGQLDDHRRFAGHSFEEAA